MTYTGQVDPDGPWSDRIDGDVAVRKLSVGEMDNNVYILSCARTGQAAIIDAADDAPRIREALGDLDAVVVLQTHGHWDHIRAWDDLAADPGLPVWGHAADIELFGRSPDRRLEDGEELVLGHLVIHVLHTPGHTPGALQFLVHGQERPHLFSGDSLFPGGLGNTWGDVEKFEQLYREVTSKVFDPLPDHTWVYPGHGDDTTLGTERPHLREWYERKW